MATEDALCPVREYPALREIHRSTIRAHHAKAGYDYPTIRLPVSFSHLIGLPTRIYQTLYNGATAFLVVISPESSALTRGDRAFESPRAHLFSFLLKLALSFNRGSDFSSAIWDSAAAKRVSSWLCSLFAQTLSTFLSITTLKVSLSVSSSMYTLAVLPISALNSLGSRTDGYSCSGEELWRLILRLHKNCIHPL